MQVKITDTAACLVKQSHIVPAMSHHSLFYPFAHTYHADFLYKRICSLLLVSAFSLLHWLTELCLYLYIFNTFCGNQSSIMHCWEPVWGTPPVAKVMRKEARHTQRRDQASGVPLEILEHLPPKQESAYFTALCSHLHLWLYGGLSPTTSLWKTVNLELQLIIIPGHDRSVATYKFLWRFSSLPDRPVRPHVIVHSLPTVRGIRCFKPSKNRFFREVRKLLV